MRILLILLCLVLVSGCSAAEKTVYVKWHVKAHWQFKPTSNHRSYAARPQPLTEHQKLQAKIKVAEQQRLLKERLEIERAKQLVIREGKERIRKEEAERKRQKVLTHQREQHRLDDLVKYFDDPKDWQTANKKAKEIKTSDDGTYSLPDLSVYLQDRAIEVIQTENTKVTGYVKEVGDKVEVSMIFNGRVLGTKTINSSDITERRLATPKEWDKIKDKNKKFDWSAYSDRKQKEKAAEDRRARSRRAERKREAEQKKLYAEIAARSNRNKKRRVTSFGGGGTLKRGRSTGSSKPR